MFRLKGSGDELVIRKRIKKKKKLREHENEGVKRSEEKSNQRLKVEVLIFF